ncbi:MAG TPA: hypothetical protein VMI06_03970 [Terriglobia bacterium]|nr:hypothetical protein [Terriglobia bacterium]
MPILMLIWPRQVRRFAPPLAATCWSLIVLLLFGARRAGRLKDLRKEAWSGFLKDTSTRSAKRDIVKD